jgi:serine/threonine protein kinase
VLSIFDQAAEALACAHANNIIHRDIKPANIMVTATDFVKLSDFGIACFTDKARKTRFGDTMGSPFWMSFQQYDDPSAADPRFDIWSLGVAMFESLMGRVPFYAGLTSELMVKIAKEPMPPLDPAISPETTAVVRKCLEKDVDDRFQSMMEFRAALPIARTTPLFVPSICQVCRTTLAADEKFCHNCGHCVAGSGRARLVVVSGPTGQVFPLDADLIHLGRQNDCEVCLTDVFISRHQATITRKGKDFFLTGGKWETGEPSANGTFLDGNNVDCKPPAPLRNGSNIRVGDTFLRFELA